MKIVDILTMDMHSLHGANKVTEMLIKGRSIFESNGLYLRYVVSQDGILDCWKYNNSILGKELGKYTYTFKRRIIEYLKKNPIYNSLYLQKVINEKIYNANKKVVSYYTGKLKSNGIKVNGRADIIIFQDPFTAQFYLKKTSDYGKSIFISHAAEDPLAQILINRPSLRGTSYELVLRNRFAFMIRKVTGTVCICPSAQKYNKKIYNRDCPCIINGIEDVPKKQVKKFSESDGKIHIAIVASVQYRKGQDIAIEALTRLNSEEQSLIHLDIMGTGNKLNEYQDKVAKLKLKDSVSFYGAVLDVENKLPYVDIFMLPSREDTVPIAILEGMRAELPIFATDVGDVPEIISGCGVLIKPDVESVKQLYKDLILKKYDLKDMRRKSRERFLKEFQLSVMIQKYSEVLNNI